MEVRNGFKGLDLIDRVPDELWMEVRDIVQEVVIKSIPTLARDGVSREVPCSALKGEIFFLGMVLLPVSCTIS